jgi:hypothetical protein
MLIDSCCGVKIVHIHTFGSNLLTKVFFILLAIKLILAQDLFRNLGKSITFYIEKMELG